MRFGFGFGSAEVGGLQRPCGRLGGEGGGARGDGSCQCEGGDSRKQLRWRGRQLTSLRLQILVFSLISLHFKIKPVRSFPASQTWCNTDDLALPLLLRRSPYAYFSPCPPPTTSPTPQPPTSTSSPSPHRADPLNWRHREGSRRVGEFGVELVAVPAVAHAPAKQAVPSPAVPAPSFQPERFPPKCCLRLVHALLLQTTFSLPPRSSYGLVARLTTLPFQPMRPLRQPLVPQLCQLGLEFRSRLRLLDLCLSSAPLLDRAWA